MPVIRAVEALDQLPRLRQRASFDVEPAEIPETGGFHHQRIALPSAHRVAEPPWLRVFRHGPAVGENLPHAGVGLIENDSYIRSLHHLARLAVSVKLHQTQRQAMRVGIVFAVCGDTLTVQLGGPWLEGQPVFERSSQVPELAQPDGERNNLGRLARRGSGRCRSGCRRHGAPDVEPDSRKIRLAVRCLGRRPGQIGLSVRGLGHAGSRIVGPLGECAHGSQGQKQYGGFHRGHTKILPAFSPVK